MVTALILATLTPALSSATPPPSADDVAMSYIVTTKPSETSAAAAEASIPAAQIDHTFDTVIDGFSAELTLEQVTALQTDPSVLSVLPDLPTHVAAVQTDPPWGLDRLDQRGPTVDRQYTYDSTGAGVTVFVLDTGLRMSHQQFGTRATTGYDFVDSDTVADDCYGHGTHVGGTVGGTTYGVAKQANLVALRVWGCDGSGLYSDMIAALDWVVANKPAGPSVVNISGGGLKYAPMDEAVQRTIDAGVPVVVAAMNDNADSCRYSPASVPAAVTVAASDRTDQRATFSNYGACVDLFAPGVDIQSAYHSADNANAVWSGTSMAAPHVTGMVARYLQSNPSATPAQVNAALVAAATPNVVGDPNGTPNRLAYAAPPATLPSAPLSVSATKDDGARTATVSWQPPASDGGSPVTGYKVGRDGVDSTGAGAWSATVAASARSQSFTLLVPGSTYNLTVQAITAAGTGPAASASATIGGPLGAPNNAGATTSDAAKSATISWTPPTFDGGSAVTGYRVSRDGTDSKGAVTWSASVAASARSQTFTSLVPGATYNLTVQAVTAAGAGPSATVTVRMTALPGRVVIGTAMSGSSTDTVVSVTANWTPPTSGGPVGSYVVRAVNLTTGAGKSMVASASARSVKVTGLAKGSYQVEVYASNAAGNGPVSARSNTITAR